MTLDTLLLLVLAIYLVLVAYGVVGQRRRRMRAKAVTGALLVLLPPGLLVVALVAIGEGALVREWGRLFLAMPVAGAIVAFAADRVARVAA